MPLLKEYCSKLSKILPFRGNSHLQKAATSFCFSVASFEFFHHYTRYTFVGLMKAFCIKDKTIKARFSSRFIVRPKATTCGSVLFDIFKGDPDVEILLYIKMPNRRLCYAYKGVLSIPKFLLHKRQKIRVGCLSHRKKSHNGIQSKINVS